MSSTPARDEQLSLVRARVRTARPRPPEGLADPPVARVAVDVPHAHLDRPFDYLVPASMGEAARPGVRVRVRFAGRLVSGYVVDRADGSERERLARLDKVVSPEPVLSPQVAALCRAVADRYAGTFADVVRLAVPPRHARVESEQPLAPLLLPLPPEPASTGWARYRAGPAFLRGVTSGSAPAAVWTALPGPEWPADLATAVAAALGAGRGALVVVPDQRDAQRVSDAVTAVCGPGRHVVLTADLGPAERYRRWLAVRRGIVRAVVGTRGAMFAPVEQLGLVAIWDDGDDLHAEPRAPYPHVREVLRMRAATEGAALLVAGLARTAEGAALLAAGGAAHPVEAARSAVRAAAPAIRAAGDDAELARDPGARSARLPGLAWRAAHDGLAEGPVLVQVPRRGYVPALACGTCRAPARCPECSGPLALGGGGSLPSCRWCGRRAGGWTCPVCDGRRMRAVVVGARRTAEELGRAFPGVAVRTSGRDGVLARVESGPALVVATPGAEPVADGGYAAALLLDGWALLGRADLRAGEEALRRWLAAAALVRPADAGGRVVVLAESALPPVQALLRWDPAGAAERELAERARLRFPPAVRMASLTGRPDAVAELLAATAVPASARTLGPLPVPDAGDPAAPLDEGVVRALVRVPVADGDDLVAALKAAQSVRSARKAADFVAVRIDPVEIG